MEKNYIKKQQTAKLFSKSRWRLAETHFACSVNGLNFIGQEKCSRDYDKCSCCFVRIGIPSEFALNI